AVRHAREVADSGGADDPSALATAAHALTFLGRDPEAGLAASKRAVLLAPHCAVALRFCAWNRLYVGDWQVAVAEIERAMRLSPVDPEMHFFTTALGAAFFVGERYEEALEWLRRSIHDRPSYLLPYRLAAACHALLGRAAEAREAVQALLALSPDESLSTVAVQSAMRDPQLRARYFDGLRKAGLPA
ncbi:MAG: tetratricopeptide repeat protein, partial [Acetobacteraceae bacterium]|nr:tetratricopeptide repeat protein [Acetobacteraceae bacterium]